MTVRTVEALADEIIADLPEKVDLIYISQGDKLTDEQVAALVAGDMDTVWEKLEDFESENKYESAKSDIDEAAKLITERWGREDGTDYDELLEAFDGSEDWDRVRYAMEDRESGDWFKDLMNGCGDVLLRINVIDEDHGYAFEPVEPERVLADVGMPDTEENRKTVRQALSECSPEYSVLLGYWIVGADVSQIYQLGVDEDTEVEITNPYLYLGNPFAGSGWITEEPLQGTVRVKRGDLCTDKAAFGYSVAEVFGGLSGSQFPAEIKAVAPPTADSAESGVT